MNASRKDLESALAFVLQSQRRLIDAERLERTVRNVQRGETQLVKHAEDQTQTAANTLDAAAMEFTDLIHDAIKDGIMRAVASMAADSAIPGVPQSIDGSGIVPKSHDAASTPSEVHAPAVASIDAPRRGARTAQHLAHSIPMGVR